MSKKKIVFDSVALGLNVLLLIFFALPVIPGASMFFFIENASLFMSAGQSAEGVILAIVTLLMILFMVLTILNICFLTVALLCDINVIKNQEKLAYAFKKTALILSSIGIAFMAIILILFIMLSAGEISYLSDIVNLLLTIAIVVLTSLAKGKKHAVATAEPAKVEATEETKESK